MFRIFCSLLMLVGLAGCDTFLGEEKIPLEGKRESVLLNQEALKPSLATVDTEVVLPQPVQNSSWAQAGGEPAHAMPNLVLSDSPQKQWSTGISSVSWRQHRLLSEPIAYDNRLYLLNDNAEVIALEAEGGKQIWRVSISQNEELGKAIGGGVAYENGTIYVTSPFAEVLALNAETGEIKWRHSVNSPVRTAPTVKDGRIFVVTINNELEALDGETGQSIWAHAGIMEAAGLLGGASPSVFGGVIVVPYSSGEVYALRVENGHPLWSESLASFRNVDSVSALHHIKARPVIDQDKVYLVSHSGRASALTLRDGTQIWSRDIGGSQSPATGGDFIFLITSDNEITCLTKDRGLVKWSKALPAFENNNFNKGKIVWSGPLLANNRLIVVGSNATMLEINAKDGEIIAEHKLSGGAFIPPIVVNGTMYLLTSNGKLTAMR